MELGRIDTLYFYLSSVSFLRLRGVQTSGLRLLIFPLCLSQHSLTSFVFNDSIICRLEDFVSRLAQGYYYCYYFLQDKNVYVQCTLQKGHNYSNGCYNEFPQAPVGISFKSVLNSMIYYEGVWMRKYSFK